MTNKRLKDSQKETNFCFISEVFRVYFQGEPSILSRFVNTVRTWAGGGGADVQLLTVEPLEEVLPATRVWLSSTETRNFDHVLLYHVNEVRKT